MKLTKKKMREMIKKVTMLALFFAIAIHGSCTQVHATTKKNDVISRVTYSGGGFDKYFYNKKGLIKKIKRYDSNGKLSWQTTFKYNQKGLLVFYTDEPINGMGHAVGYTLEYDKKGRLIKFDSGASNRGDVSKYIYKNGKVVKIKDYVAMGATYEGSRKVSYKKGRISKIGKTKFTYDKKGNLSKISGNGTSVIYYSTYKGSRLVAKTESSEYGSQTLKYTYKKIKVSKGYRKRVKNQQWMERNDNYCIERWLYY